MQKKIPVINNILETIGNTPLVELSRQDTGLCRLYVKLENQNPGGSIKDRIALSMITDAEKGGKLNPGGTIVEATAGNTGIGLSLVARMKGYKVILVIPDKMSQEKIMLLRAMGAEVILTRSDVNKGHPEYYQDMAERISKEITGAYFINQFGNPANPLAHETTTGPEIYKQLDGKVDAVVCGIGSSGTLTGLTHYFKKVKPDIEMVIADPKGSVIKDFVTKGTIGEAGSWLVEGIGEDFIPPIADFSLTKKAYSINDEESFYVAGKILNEEGILAGSSSGTLIAAALKYCKEQSIPKTVVTFICDSGNKYITKMFNKFWMRDNGFTEKVNAGNLNDIITRSFLNNEIVYLRPGDSLQNAFQKMKLYDISQLPVIEGTSIVGVIDESDLLHSFVSNRDSFFSPVRNFMTTNLETLSPNAKISDVMDIFASGMVPIVIDKDTFIGLITKIDMINYLTKNKIQNEICDQNHSRRSGTR
jgi:cystathionine beta-synthase